MIIGCPSWFVHHGSCIVNNCFEGHLLNYWLDLTKLTRMILILPSIILVHMVTVRCISRSHRLKIDFRNENFKNLFVLNHKD